MAEYDFDAIRHKLSKYIDESRMTHTIGVMYTAKSMGLRIPDDISVCGFTNGNRAVACDPQLTTVEQRGVDVGKEAADILIDKVEGMIPNDKIEKRVVRTRLVVRGSSR